jgi:hypothetical protein
MARFGNKYGELDEVVTPDAHIEHRVELEREQEDASKHLFGQVDWDDFLRTGNYLSQSEVRPS